MRSGDVGTAMNAQVAEAEVVGDDDHVRPVHGLTVELRRLRQAVASSRL
jgi:hypothetical protein